MNAFRKAFEHLSKTPMDTAEASPGLLEGWLSYQKGKPILPFQGEVHTSTKQLPGGLYHHIYDSSQSDGPLGMGAPIRHILSESPDPKQPGAAHMYVHPEYEGNKNEVWGVYVDPAKRGRGLGRGIYDAAIAHHGSLQSGHQITQQANKVWNSLAGDPKYKTNLGAYPEQDKEYSNASRHTTKLAASEKPLKKSPYGPAGMGLYSDADNARRKMNRSSLSATKPTVSQQASQQAASDKARSKKNPVKVYTQAEINHHFRNRFKVPKVA